jgi:hypothetical protein
MAPGKGETPTDEPKEAQNRILVIDGAIIKEPLQMVKDEYMSAVSRTTKKFAETQNEAAEAIRDFAENFLESTNVVVNSIQSAWALSAKTTGYY